MNEAPCTTVIYDDREFINSEVKSYVGTDHYGDIIYSRHNLLEQFKAIMPKNIRNFYHIRDSQDLVVLQTELNLNLDNFQ